MNYAKYLILAFIALFIINIETLHATHAMGADLTYRCLGNNQYEVTLTFYRDCAGVSAPGSVSVSAVSGCISGQTVTATLQKDPIFSSLEVTPLCPSQRLCSSCVQNPGPNCTTIYPGVEVYTYMGVIALPSACANWSLSWSTCCRNNAITNLNAPGSRDMYLNVLINNANGLCNNSPVFSALPTPYVCKDQLYNYNHGVIEPDGDSLVYSLINPMENNAAAIPYANPYTVASPLASHIPMTFNQVNGQIAMIPSLLQSAVMVVRVKEYRNGVLVGEIIRDIQVVILDCSSFTQIVPEVGHVQNPMGGTYIIDSISVGICPFNNLSFEVVGTDGNIGDSVFMWSNFETVFPGGTYTVTGNNPTTTTFDWTPVLADTGTHYFVVSVKDNNCPIVSTQSQAYAVTVLNETRAGPDQKFCTVGGPVTLTARGGSLFHWTPRNTIVDAAPDSSWIKVFPTTTTLYKVSSDCNHTDSTLVEVVPSYNYTIATDDTICKFEESNLWISTDPVYSPYQYTWTPEYNIDTNGLDQLIANPFVSTQYFVETISKDGCRVLDSINVFIIGESPRVTIKPDKDYLCRDNDQINIELLAAPGSCGPSAFGCTGNSVIVDVGEAIDLSDNPTPFKGNFKYSRMQILYTKSDLNNIGIYGGTISEIGFNIGLKASTQAYKNFNIKIGCSELKTLSGEFKDNLTPVYNSSSVITTTGWNSYNLSTAYDWDGFTNLIVEVCFSNTSSTLNDFVTYTPTSYNSVLFRFAENGGPGCDLIGAIPISKRPNIRFAICSQPLSGFGIQWTPTAGVDNPNVGNTFISNISQSSMYHVEVNNSGCLGLDSFMVNVDTTVINVSADTLICNLIPVDLKAEAIGRPPDLEMICGANNSPVLYPSDDFVLSNSAKSSGATMFKHGVTDMRYQILLRAVDLKDKGLEAGIITELSFQLKNKSTTTPALSFNINMGCTASNALSNSSFEPVNGTVYSINSYNSVAGWNDFILTNPYDWDGISNLIVEICWENGPGNVLIGTDNIMVEDVSYTASSRGYENDSLGVTLGCQLTSPRFAYSLLPNLKLSIVPPPPGNFEYVWNQIIGGNELVDTLVQNPTVNPTVSSAYEIEVQTEFGCTLLDTVYVDVSLLQTSVSADTGICVTETAILSATGGDIYEWQPRTNKNLSHPDSSFTYTSPDVTTTFTVTIMDNIGCENTEEVTITVNDLPVVDAGPPQTILIGLSATMDATQGAQNYTWEPNTNITGSNTYNAVVTPIETTIYTLTLIDENGCVNSDTVSIMVESVDDVYIPTAFTPNGDGKNDIYYITPIGLTEMIEFKIFNRWGQIVYDAPNFSDGWDGMIFGVPAAMGTYTYLLIGLDYKSERLTKKGNITLIR